MKITVEFLLTHSSAIYEVGRIPCIGEMVCLGDECYEVKMVMHLLDSDRDKAIVRVK